jgi:filamentous hemagglutinin
MDIVVRDRTGTLHGIEVKSGTGRLDPYQLSKNRFINMFGGEAFGNQAESLGIAGRTIQSITTVKVP